jgi:RimJ/RimL family protein N-acetyltransferase
MLRFKEFNRSTETTELVEFLTSQPWPFHGQVEPKEEGILKSLKDGFYTRDGNRTFWIDFQDDKIGLIRLFDLEDPTCLFDIRIKREYCGKGRGSESVEWISQFAFTHYSHMIRIEGHTRHDNLPMRKTFSKTGFVKEAYHRKAWPQSGELYDSVGYAMLREDWKNGTITPIHDIVNF